MEFKRRGKIQQTVDITPLIDVVFQLIIFFMLTGTMIIQEGIDLQLPDSRSAESIPEEQVVVSLDREGRTFFKKLEFPLGELEEQLRLAGEKSVILKADSGVQVERLVEVMDAVRRSGIESISLATEAKK